VTAAGAVTLYVGTKRGLFLVRWDVQREAWTISEPRLAGQEVYHALADPRVPGRAWAATDHAVWGAHVHRSDDDGANWTLLQAAPHHTDDRGLKAIWYLSPGGRSETDTLYAGIEPAGLFVSRDAGTSWEAVTSLNDHPTNSSWQPAGGGLALHSIIIDPDDELRIYCALSAGGVYRSDDGGASWQACNDGVRADFLPDRYPRTGQCVHKLRLHPARSTRLYQQNHCGVYRSDDRGATWTEITKGLPSDFGYALAIDPRDPDTLYVIPEESSHMRATVDGRLRVYRSRSAGDAWHALDHGLPGEHAYVSILRDAMDEDGLDPLGIYFGTSSGHLFGSRDGGDSWQLIAGFLPKILSVTAAPSAGAGG
jgi:photosystem II stability/assembly factor-like uncharacterized protein